VEHKEDFQVELVHILENKVKVLRNKSIILVTVQWTYYGSEDAMWEHDEATREECLQAFENFEER
jgi:hypothetical protein